MISAAVTVFAIDGQGVGLITSGLLRRGGISLDAERALNVLGVVG
jgi:hypothetical protein